MSSAQSRKLGASLVAALLALVVFLPGAALAAQVTPPPFAPTEAPGAALAWMKSQQKADGSFAGFGAGSTVDALLAIEAAGQDPTSFTSGGKSALDFLQSQASSLAQTPGGAGKLLLAVSTPSKPVTSFGGVDLLAAINSSYDAGTGHYGKDVIGDAFAVLGLKAAGQKVPAGALKFLEGSQNSDGGWSFSGEQGPGKSDTNTTAVVLQALTSIGGAQPLTTKQAVTYLASQQNPDGGWPYQQGGQYGSDSDVNSTAYVVQSQLALGNTTLAEGGRKFILSMQKADGAFQWQKTQPDDNAGATYQAIPALLGVTLVPGMGPQPTTAPAAPSNEPAKPGTLTPGMPATGGNAPIPPALLAVVLSCALVITGAVLRRRPGYRQG